MIEIIACLMFVTLSLVAALHLVWASGSTWPVANREQFARNFIGTDSGDHTPCKALCAQVALLIFAGALLPLWTTDIITSPLPAWSRPLSMWVLFTVFALRGLSAYALPNLPRAEPFRTLDRRYYSPLCLLLAAGYLAIILRS